VQRRRLDPPAGPLLAEDDGAVLRARGVPYARADRFTAPQAIAPWPDVRDATARGPVCPQSPSRLEWVTGPVVDGLEMSEDCQVLSVTAPSDANGLPVMVWLHGGAYVSGGGEAPKYDADELARGGRVVVVTVTYRLGVFGYLSPSGVDNLGLRDQILALQWVHDNIGAFGGDPDRVTVFGQSAGADSVLSLMLCEQTTGLFRRAVMQSAPLGVRHGRDAMTAAMLSAAGAALDGAGPEGATTDQLLDAETAAASAAARFGLIGRLPFGPIMGTDPLPTASNADDRLADAARRIELLIGYTNNDGAPFVAMDRRVATDAAAAAALTRRVFSAPARRLAATWRGFGGRSATFQVGWSPPRAPLGACHCIELPLLFDAPAWADAPMLGGDAVDDRLAETMRRNWSGFAHHGVDALDSPALRVG
jgi:para-nitrobenzyl esterase